MLDLFTMTVVLTRFFAIYMLMYATFSIPTSLIVINQTTAMDRWFKFDGIILIIAGLAYVTVALILLIFAKKFASYITRGIENQSIQISEDHYHLLQTVSFTLLGAYILTFAIPNLVKIIALYVFSDNSTQDDVGLPTTVQQWTVPLEYLIQEIV